MADEEVEAGVSGVGAGYGYDVGDGVRAAVCFAEGLFAGLDCEVDASFAEEDVELGDGVSDGAIPEGIIVGFDG